MEREVLPVAATKVISTPPIVPLVRLPVWEAPETTVTTANWAGSRTKVRQALAEGRLFAGADDAVPLLMAMHAVRADDRWVRRQSAALQARLLREVDGLLHQESRQRQALAAAAQRLSVLAVWRPDDPDVARRIVRLTAAQERVAINRRGEAALRKGRLGLDGEGALADFNAVLATAPDDVRALQGVAAVESALLRRALSVAEAGEFAQAATWLGRAEALRSDDETVSSIALQVERIRNAQLDHHWRKGLQALQSAAGMRLAEQQLERMRAVALPEDARVRRLGGRIALARRYGLYGPGQVMRDALRMGGAGPVMVVVPAGVFTMGALPDELGAQESEHPSHSVQFDRGFAMSVTEVSVGQFRQFVEQSGARPRATRRGHSTVYEPRTGNFVRLSGVDWADGYDGRPAADNAPVMHVSVRDAEAYAAWLSEQTGQYYRLPSEAEFEYALRAGGQGRYPWGNASTPPVAAGNLTGSRDVSPTGKQWTNAFPGYGDDWWGVAPVGQFAANAWGLHDMEGNLSEWVADCWHASYRRAPADGVAWFNPGCRQRVVRGANWANAPVQARSAWRWQQDSDVTSARIGFRVVRGL